MSGVIAWRAGIIMFMEAPWTNAAITRCSKRRMPCAIIPPTTSAVRAFTAWQAWTTLFF